MLPLRDRLRAAAPISPAPAPSASPEPECWTRKTLFPATPGMTHMTSEAIGLAAALALPPDTGPGDILYLDTETTGLSGGAGTLAFMVGIGVHTADGFRVDQYMMRDYDEERDMLRRVAERLSHARVICTFNGKTFDLPLLYSRFTLARIRPPCADTPHIDLMHAARRVYKLRLGRCPLTRLEEALGLTAREDDLPGSEAPARFFQLVKTGDMVPMEDVLRHNAQDVASLGTLLARLCEAYAAPERQENAEDTLSIGRALERQGLYERARVCYRAADRGTVSAVARARLSDSYRRARDHERAAAVLRRMLDDHQGGVAPAIALSKLLEHRMGDPVGALRVALQALSAAAEPGLHAPNKDDVDDLVKRVKRLNRKVTVMNLTPERKRR